MQEAQGVMQQAVERGYIGIGLLGVGVVGGGVADTLLAKGAQFAQRAGLPLKLTRALVRNVAKARSVELPPDLLTTDPRDVVASPDTDIVVEVLGGEEPARRLILEALRAGKHVVTANKEVIAKHGPELLAAARQNNVDLRFEATVGAGIPIINALQNSLAANEFSGIWAIINGTTNYMVTRMAAEGLDFQTCLAEAQKLGYAEPDPTNDVEGIDAAYKLSILASLAFGAHVRPEDVYREGISKLHARDFRYAREMGYAIKLLAIAEAENGAIQARVHPVFLPEEMLLASVDGVFNAIQVQGDLVGQMVFYGRGAGAKPTASGLIGDVLDVAQAVRYGEKRRVAAVQSNGKRIAPIQELNTRYYFRIIAADRPGVLAQISRVFGEHSISIASVIQKETDEVAQTAELVILSHTSNEASVRKAVDEMRKLPVVEDIGSLIRVEV